MVYGIFPDAAAKPASIPAMLPETHPLIEAVTKPLADNAEQRLAANALLGETFDPDHAGVGAAISRLERIDRMKRPWLPFSALCALAVLSLAALAFAAHSMNRSFALMRSINDPDPAAYKKFYTRFSSEELLILGDPALSRLRQKEALHLSAPDRPDYYAEFAGAYFAEHDALPPDYHETARRLDPGNAFFLYNAAGKEGGESVRKIEKQKATGEIAPRMRDGMKLRPLPGETGWKVDDPAAFGKALEMIAAASRMPRFDSYERAMAEARIPLFDQSDITGRIHALVYQASQTTQTVSLRKVADLLCAGAYLSSLEGDEEKFLMIHGISEAFLGQLCSTPPEGLVAELVYHLTADIVTRALYHGAVRLGMDELAVSLGEREAAFQEARDIKQIGNDRIDGNEAALKKEGSMLQALMLPLVSRQVANPPQLDGGNLKPGRLADHDLVSAMAMSCIAIILLPVALLVLLFRLRAPRHVRILAGRFAHLLEAGDWLWICGAGVALPFAIVFCISWLTPFGGRELGLRATHFLFPLIHFNILLLLLFSVPPSIVRWRLAGRLAPFGLGMRMGWLGISISVLGVIASLLPSPIMGWKTLPSSAMMAVALVFSLWQGAILFGICRAMLGKQETRIPKAIVGHALLPVHLVALILSVAAVLLIFASANRWISKDLLTKAVPTGLGQFEADVAAEKRREVNAILGFE